MKLAKISTVKNLKKNKTGWFRFFNLFIIRHTKIIMIFYLLNNVLKCQSFLLSHSICYIFIVICLFTDHGYSQFYVTEG